MALVMGFEMVDDKTEELPGYKFARIEFPLSGPSWPDEKKKTTKR